MKFILVTFLFFGSHAFSCVNLNGLYGQYSGASFEIKQKGCQTVEIFGTEPGTFWSFGYKSDLPIDGKEYHFSLDQHYKLDKPGSVGKVKFKAQFVDQTLELYMYSFGPDYSMPVKLYKFKTIGNKVKYSVEGKNWANQDYYEEYLVDRYYRDYLTNPDFRGQFEFSATYGLSPQQVSAVLLDLENIVDPNHFYAPMAFVTNTGVCQTNATPSGAYCVVEVEKNIEQYASLKTLNIVKVTTEVSLDEAVDKINRIHFDGHLGAIMAPNACVIRQTKLGNECVILVK